MDEEEKDDERIESAVQELEEMLSDRYGELYSLDVRTRNNIEWLVYAYQRSRGRFEDLNRPDD